MARVVVSDRRELHTTIDDSGELAYIGLWVDGVQIAGAVRQDELYAACNNDARWSLWSCGLRPRSLLGDPPSANAARPLPVADEHDARAWLTLLATLAEQGPTAVTR